MSNKADDRADRELALEMLLVWIPLALLNTRHIPLADKDFADHFLQGLEGRLVLSERQSAEDGPADDRYLQPGPLREIRWMVEAIRQRFESREFDFWTLPPFGESH